MTILSEDIANLNIALHLKRMEEKAISDIALECEERIRLIAGKPVKIIIQGIEVLSSQTICAAVCGAFRITEEEIKSKKRLSRFVLARIAYSHLSYSVYEIGSLKEVGRYIGDRDHTTIRHHIQEFESKISSMDFRSKYTLAFEALSGLDVSFLPVIVDKPVQKRQPKQQKKYIPETGPTTRNIGIGLPGKNKFA